MKKEVCGTYDYYFDDKKLKFDSKVGGTKYDKNEPTCNVKRWSKDAKQKTTVDQLDALNTDNRGIGGIDNHN